MKRVLKDSKGIYHSCIAVALAALFIFQACANTFALAPESRYSPGKTTSPGGRSALKKFLGESTDRITQEIRRDMQFCKEVLEKSGAYTAGEQETLLDLLLQRFIYHRIGADFSQHIVKNQPFPISMENLLEIGSWLATELPERIRKEVGHSSYFDITGDVIGVLATALLEKDPQAFDAWSATEQQAAIWILLINAHHIALHQCCFEAFYPYGVITPNISLEPRPFDDLLSRATHSPLGYLTQQAIEDRPLVERLRDFQDLYEIPQEAKRQNLPSDVIHHYNEKEPLILTDTGTIYRTLMDMLWGRWSPGRTADPSVLDLLRLSETYMEPARIRLLKGLWKLHHIPWQQAVHSWDATAREWLKDPRSWREYTPVLQWISDYADIQLPLKTAPTQNNLQLESIAWNPEQRFRYPYLTQLGKQLPSGWHAALTDDDLEKLDNLITHAFSQSISNGFRHSYPEQWPFENFWSPADIKNLSKRLPGTGSGEYKLAILLHALFPPLFDVHSWHNPLSHPEGSWGISLDPMLGTLPGIPGNSDPRARNLEHYGRMIKLLSALQEKSPTLHATLLETPSPKWMEKVRVVDREPQGDDEIQFLPGGFIGESRKAQILEVRYQGRTCTAKIGLNAGDDMLAMAGLKSEAMIYHHLNNRNIAGIPRMAYVLNVETRGVKQFNSDPMTTAILWKKLPPGETLAQRIARTGPLSEEDTLILLVKAVRILEALQEAGVYHWDIKPEHFWIADNGELFLIDFDISFRTWEEFKRRHLHAFSTPPYATALRNSWTIGNPPSKQEFHPAEHDVYSLALVALDLMRGVTERISDYSPFIMLGEIPFETGTDTVGEDWRAMARKWLTLPWRMAGREPPLWLAKFPEELSNRPADKVQISALLQRVLQRALADGQSQYKTMGEFRMALEAHALRLSPTSPGTISIPGRIPALEASL